MRWFAKIVSIFYWRCKKKKKLIIISFLAYCICSRFILYTNDSKKIYPAFKIAFLPFYTPNNLTINNKSWQKTRKIKLLNTGYTLNKPAIYQHNTILYKSILVCVFFFYFFLVLFVNNIYVSRKYCYKISEIFANYRFSLESFEIIFDITNIRF